MLRICLVDDDALLLSGMQRVLRRAAPSVELTCANSGPEALALLEQQSVDVVLTDLSMPGMDGETLLRHVQARFPHMTRVLSTGALDAYRAFDLQLVAHRSIAKPMPAANLVALLTGFAEWHEQRRLLPDSDGDREIAWHSAAAERLRVQSRVITADVARQNPWLAMLLLQATHGGFVEAGTPLDVSAAVRALGPARLEIMARRLQQLPLDGRDVSNSHEPTPHLRASMPLVALTHEIARSVAPAFVPHPEGGSDDPQLPAHFVAVAETAAVLRAAAIAMPSDADRLLALRVALDAERFGVPRVIVEAIRESVLETEGDVVAPGVVVRWAAALLQEPDCLHTSDAAHTLHGTVALAARDRWRELARLSRAEQRSAA